MFNNRYLEYFHSRSSFLQKLNPFSKVFICFFFIVSILLSFQPVVLFLLAISLCLLLFFTKVSRKYYEKIFYVFLAISVFYTSAITLFFSLELGIYWFFKGLLCFYMILLLTIITTPFELLYVVDCFLIPVSKCKVDTASLSTKIVFYLESIHHFFSELDRGFEILSYRGLDVKYSNRKGRWIAYRTVTPYAARKWNEKRKDVGKIIEMRKVPFQNKKTNFHPYSTGVLDVILVSIYGIIMVLVILVEVIL